MHKGEFTDDEFYDWGFEFEFDRYAKVVFGLDKYTADSFTSTCWVTYGHGKPVHAGQRILYLLKHGKMPKMDDDYQELTLENWTEL